MPKGHRVCVGGEFGAEMAQEGREEILIDLPGAVLIRVSEGGA